MTLKDRVSFSDSHTRDQLSGERCENAQRRGSVAEPNRPTRLRNSRGLLLRKGIWHIEGEASFVSRDAVKPSVAAAGKSSLICTPRKTNGALHCGAQRTQQRPKLHFGSRNPKTHQASTRGLLLRKGIWHIDKVLFGKRICESTHSSDLNEAEMLLAHRVSQARKAHLYGEPGEHTFREAGIKFLKENQHKRSIERDVRALKALDPFIGSLPLKRIHQGTLEPYIQFQRKKGNCGATINRELAVVKRILNLASRYWRDDRDLPWMSVAPMLPRLRQLHQRQSYPLSPAEQRLLFSELKGHLRTMALFKVNTGVSFPSLCPFLL
jgi:hypothetical protein